MSDSRAALLERLMAMELRIRNAMYAVKQTRIKLNEQMTRVDCLQADRQDLIIAISHLDQHPE